MPSRSLARWLLVLVLAVIGMVAVSAARAQPVANPLWLVQIGFPSLPAEANPDAYPGRVEVTNAGAFVGCAWATWYSPSSGEVRLVPMAVGYAVTGRREDIRVEVFGELNRLGGMQVKISQIAGPIVGLPSKP